VLACEPGPLRVLFVGNSYTSVNDLPGTLQQLAQASGARTVQTASDTPGGFTLQQHWASGQDVALLNGSRFDWMVLQDQSQEPGLPLATLETDLYPYVTLLADAASDRGTKTMLFLTWARQQGDPEYYPNDTYDAMQARVIFGYETIAARLDLPVAPVGIAWRSALLQYPGIQLWDVDGSHPTVAGTYLAACVFYEMMVGSSVGNGFTAGLPPSTATALQMIAASTVDAYVQP
jgi:hypothetical protein